MKKDKIETLIPYYSILDNDTLFSFNDKYKDLFKSSIVENKDGSLICSLKVEFADFNFQNDILNLRSKILSSFISTLSDKYIIFYTLKRDNKDFIYKSPQYELTGSSYYIEEKRKEFFTNCNIFTNTIYFTIQKLSIKNSIGIESSALEDFCEKTYNFILCLEEISAKVEILKKENLLSFLYERITTIKNNFLLIKKDNKLFEVLNSFDFKLNSLPLLIKDGSVKKYIKNLSIIALPEFTHPLLFKKLYSLNIPYTLTIKYETLSKENSEKLIKKKQSQYKNSIYSLKDSILSELNGEKSVDSDKASRNNTQGYLECDDAMEYLQNTNTSSGFITIVISVSTENEEKTEQYLSYIKDTLRDIGFFTKEEGFGNTLSHFSTLPGFITNFRALHTLCINFTDLLLLSSYYKGALNNKLIEKRSSSDIPFIYAINKDYSPYYFSLSGETGQKGHTLIVGSTGSGKSVLLSLMIASILKYQNTRALIIDRDLSSLNITASNGGNIIYPLQDDTSFTPLNSDITKREDCINFLKAICVFSNIEWNSKIRKDSEEALSLLYENDSNITNFYIILKAINKNSELLNGLQPFIKGGVYEKLFDAKNSFLNLSSRITLIETNRFIKLDSSSKNNISLVLIVYLLNAISSKFNDCVPTLLIMDEAWSFIKTDVFKSYFEEWIKTLRKKNVDVVFTITNITDATKSEIAETIIANTETKIILNDKTLSSEFVKDELLKIGITEDEINELSQSEKYSALVKNEGKSSVINFLASLNIDMLSTTEEMKKEFYE